jgi:DNA-binding transcriptional regulator/RsmH inhibitor MraZ
MWRWGVVRLDSIGRIVLPPQARTVLSADRVHGLSRNGALVLRVSGPGAGARVDARGRLLVPVWLRQASAPTGELLVGTHADPSLVIISPVRILDDLGDVLIGGDR